ncbi:MAG: AmmeMemoRadiSam system radical SAM enzyme [Treponema sp.]|nr:AmmeMemoRadiSam system radical SAM enzyme [Treponema sp.]
MERPAFFIDGADGTIRCRLCPRFCAIPDGSFGGCGVRGNKNGKALLPFYGRLTALAADPIEKKPLYHFRPGTSILSAGFAGCNLHCPFCQNWRISQIAGSADERMHQAAKPGDIVSAALREGSGAIAYTYSEPLVHAEFLLDCMELARRHGIANVLVTNGCVNAEPAGEILALADAANIDLKCFSHDSYAKILAGSSGGNFFETVLDFIKRALAENVHVEITTLVVPEFNDSVEEMDKCIDFIESLSAYQPPWHLSAYHPDYRWNAPPSDPVFLTEIKERAEKKLKYVYAGNIPGMENNTCCPHCGTLLVRRRGYKIDLTALAPPPKIEHCYRCAKCGEKTPIRV